MKTQRSSVRKENRFEGQSFGTELNKVIASLCVWVAVAIVFPGRVMGAVADWIPILSASASADDGHTPANAFDGSIATRWSAQGDGQWIRFDLGTNQPIGSVSIAWYQGDQRRASFEIQTSGNGTNWTLVYTGPNSGTTSALETSAVLASTGRYLRIVGHGNSVSGWNSVTEVQVFRPSVGLRLLIDPASPRLAGSLNGSAVALDWDRQAGATYLVQASSNLVSWEDIGGAITNSGVPQTWVESAATISPWRVRFYRTKRVAEPALIADFTATPLLGVAPLAATFTDQSTGGAVAWNWSFGDGGTSSEQSPSHVYLLPGDYTVTLIVRNHEGATNTKTA